MATETETKVYRRLHPLEVDPGLAARAAAERKAVALAHDQPDIAEGITPEKIVEDALRMHAPEFYEVEGPISERREIVTPWGKAWAEEGSYIARLVRIGDVPVEGGQVHIVQEPDLEAGYAVADE